MTRTARGATFMGGRRGAAQCLEEDGVGRRKSRTGASDSPQRIRGLRHVGARAAVLAAAAQARRLGDPGPPDGVVAGRRGRRPALRPQAGWARAAAAAERLGLVVVAAAVITVNWGVYIWSVNAGRGGGASLGYFINPLVSIALGVLLLGERLQPAQWTAVGVGLLAVLVLAVRVRAAAVDLAGPRRLSFGTYGLVKKKGGPPRRPGSLAARDRRCSSATCARLSGLARLLGPVDLRRRGVGHAALLCLHRCRRRPFRWSASGPPRSGCRCPRWGCCSTSRPSSSSSSGWWPPRGCRRSGGPEFGLVWVALVLLTWDALRSARPGRFGWPERKPAAVAPSAEAGVESWFQRESAV